MTTSPFSVREVLGAASACGAHGSTCSSMIPILSAAERIGIMLEQVEPWAPHAEAAPKTSRTEKGDVVIEANGTPTCAGGWQFHFANVRGSQAYRIRARTEYHDLPNPRDCLVAQVLWGKWDPRDPNWG